MSDRIRFSARIDREGRLTVRPAFLTAIPPARWTSDTLVYVAEVFDAEGRALSRVPLSSSGTCEGQSISLRGSVDLPDGATRLDVLHVDGSGREPIVLGSVAVPARAPEVRLLETPDGQAEGEFRLAWEATGEPAPVRFHVDYSAGGGAWRPLSLGLSESSVTIDLAALAGGEGCRLAVTASNGMRATRVESPPFRVPIKPCAAVILRPVDGDTVASDVLLVGNGWWREEGRPELEALTWFSDVQGELGRGRSLAAHLERGMHRLTLRAGGQERVGESSVTVQVA
ncbi:hypothetical protein TBR22_A06390 [Luteitalea sp. TBR-22]|uniref:hypothetical protein n=1 Tax=Luteitalea sp. TBR-22 TaxID=2802971 RepID=UPI001AF709CF|nr:hypothetical protein [Luteitalea sp. TBR-22]BCS31438.1 hypothetical protein TBR22_A06390 [Luteitalea sp. TBR-22]